MPKINVYLPEGLANEVKNAGVPVSAVCQRALERVVRDMSAIQPPVFRPSFFGVYGRFLARTRAAVELAYDAARRRGHNRLASEHLLLGILEQGSNFAVQILESLGVSPDEVILKINELAPAGRELVHNATLDSLLADDAKKVLSLATREAARLDHNYIGTEHILYGLAAAEDGLAQAVLRGFGVSPEAITRTHKELVGAWVAADMISLSQPADADDESGQEPTAEPGD